MSAIKNLLAERNDLRTSVELYKRYVTYLHEWYREHSSPEFENMEPVCFEEYCDNEGTQIVTYSIRVEVTEANHILCDYTECIEIDAPIHLRMDQLKEYIKNDSKFSIEELIEPTTDTPDVVTIEIYDFDIELIEVKYKEK